MSKNNFIFGYSWFIYDGFGDPNEISSYSLAIDGINYLNGNCLGAIFAPDCGGAPIDPLPKKIRAAIARGVENGLGQFVGGVVLVAMKPC